MAQQYVNPTLLGAGPAGTSFLAAIQDANNHIAVGTTEFVQLPSGLLLPKVTDANGMPLHTSRVTTQLTSTALAASDTYTQGWQDAQALAVTFVAGSVTADQAGTLYIDYSDDGTNVARTTTLLAFSPTTAGTANADAPAYPVSLPLRYFRYRYVNGSTAQGTFALYQTPLSDWSPREVEATGSSAPVPGAVPKLVATVPYSDFTTASQSIYGFLPQCMNRNVRARTLIITNTMDQGLTSVGFYPYDSQTAEGSPSQVDGGFTWGSGPGSGGGVFTLTSEMASQGGAGSLAIHVDSFQYGLGIGSTLPTGGNVYIHIVEQQ